MNLIASSALSGYFSRQTLCSAGACLLAAVGFPLQQQSQSAYATISF